MIRRYLDRSIRQGRLHLLLPGGRKHTFGEGSPEVTWSIRGRGTLAQIVAHPGLMLGETYVDGQWDLARGTLIEFLEILFRNFQPSQRNTRLWARVARLAHQWNPPRRSRRNAAHHYDLDDELFPRFLDPDLQYSCAYFPDPGFELEEAQRAKCRHLAAKLRLEPGHRVLDIGCGWGGLALELARTHDVEVTGLSLAKNQVQRARDRAEAEGLDARVRFCLEDYRRHRGRYDRVVSVGMFEHVGRPHFRTFFDTLEGLLEPDGVAVLHTIGRTGPGGSTNAWIRRHIFPGGYIPALSEVSRALEPSGLLPADVEVLRLHYALTLEAWSRRFADRRAELVQRLGERFCRMWEFYLAVSEASFRWDDLVVYQFQLIRDPTVLPLVRDYLYRDPEPARLSA